MKEAIGKYVNDEEMVFLGGFGNGITYSAAHEIIRQKKRKLKICKCSGGILFDQLIGAGVNIISHIAIVGQVRSRILLN